MPETPNPCYALSPDWQGEVLACTREAGHAGAHVNIRSERGWPAQEAPSPPALSPFTPTPGQRTRLGIDDPPAPPQEVPGDDPDRYAAQLQQIPTPSPQVCRVVVPDAGEYAVCGSLLEAGGACPVHGRQA